MNPDVAVIGGGVAGLAAAVQMADRGARVLVLEGKAVLGGRAASFTDPQMAERVDNGQHVLVGCYHETFRFLKAIGTDDRVRLQPNLDVQFIDRTGTRTRLQCQALPPPLNLLAGLMQWEALGFADKMAALKMATPLRVEREGQRAEGRGQKRTTFSASPGETVEQWLINNGQTARLREMLWEPLALAALNQSVRTAAAPPFARVLAQMFSGEPRDAALGFPSCPLDDLFVGPARSFIERRGGEVRAGSPARVVIGRAQLSVEARGETIRPRSVISAVPWYALPDLFDGETQTVAGICRAAAGTAASPIASVNVWLDRRVLSTPFLGLPGRRLQWVFDKAQMFDEGGSHLTLIASGAEDLMAMTTDALTALALGELRDVLPESRAARVLRVSVVRERRASFSLSPGQPQRPGTRTDVEGLVLAGDWIDTGLPATIEGAVVSGRLAAEALL